MYNIKNLNIFFLIQFKNHFVNLQQNIFFYFTEMIMTKWPDALIVVVLTNIVTVVHLLLTGIVGDAAQAASSSTMMTTKSGQIWPATKCAMSEYTCTNGKCIQLNKYCDNINDCGDSSDEPRFCTRKFLSLCFYLR